MKRDRIEALGATAVSRFSSIKAGGGKTWLPARSLLARWLRSLGNPPLSFVLWNGQEAGAPQAARQWRLHIHDQPALLKLLADPQFQFGELFSAGRIELEGDLVPFLEMTYRAYERGRLGRRLGELRSRLHPPRRNTFATARDNIHHHYDIGNDFYRLWLDERMLYTCAYFEAPGASLEQAQLAKMDHVARKLRLKPGQRVVEAGCGWGALALHMAQHYGVTVKAYNISREQIAYAQQSARRAGLAERVEFIEADFREIRGKFDVFVSVGMLEHVGPKNYAHLGAAIDACLTDDGVGLIHSIGRNRRAPMNPWIERRIFPGAYPPSLREMTPIFERFGFSVLDVENLRLHYARTLEHWLARFDSRADEVRAMFDETFVRTWRLYLAGSIAAFSTGDLQLFQAVFARAANNAIPWTREFLYRHDTR